MLPCRSAVVRQRGPEGARLLLVPAPLPAFVRKGDVPRTDLVVLARSDVFQVHPGIAGVLLRKALCSVPAGSCVSLVSASMFRRRHRDFGLHHVPRGQGCALLLGQARSRIFYFRDALFEFTNVFCDRGDFVRSGSGLGLLCACLRPCRPGLLASRLRRLLSRLGSRWVCSFLLPRVALGHCWCLLREQRRDEPL